MSVRRSLLSTLLLAGLSLGALSEGAIAAGQAAADIAMAQTLRQKADPASALQLGLILKRGLPISAENPLRRPDLAGAQASFEQALAGDRKTAARAAVELARLLSDDGRSDADQRRALELLQKAAELGDAAAATETARLYEEGSILTKDLAAARRFYTIGLTGDQPAAAFGLARIEAAEGADKSAVASYEAQGLMLLRRRAETDGGAALDLAIRYRDGQGVEASPDKAIGFFNVAIRFGQTSAQKPLMKLLAEHGSAEQYAEARRALVAATGNGSVAAARLLIEDALGAGKLGVDGDLARALSSHIEGFGDWRGTYLAAMLAESGKLFPPDAAKSAALFDKVLETSRDDPNQLVRMGRSIAKSNNTSAGTNRAFLFFKTAAASGSAEGAVGAADLILQGEAGGDSDLKLVIEWLQDAAKSDNPQALVALGDAYREGKGVPRSLAEAATHYEEAIRRFSLPLAMERRANLYLDSSASAADGRRAVDLLAEAARRGRTTAMVSLGRLYRNGRFVVKDEAAARDWFSKAAALGVTHAYVELGDLLASGPDTVTGVDAAMQAYMKAWQAGDAEGGFRLAQIMRDKGDVAGATALLQQSFDRGNGASGVELARLAIAAGRKEEAATYVDRALVGSLTDDAVALDVARAIIGLPDPDLSGRGVALLRRLDAGGNAAATRIIAEMALDARLGPFDRKEAEFWARKAAERGAVQPLFTLAADLIKGERIAKDPAAGMMLLEEAHRAAPSHVQTIVMLARRYQTGGEGTAQDTARALELYKNAAQFGSVSAQVLVARAYADGSGTPRDPEKAIYWFSRAADQGSLQAMVELGRYHAAGEGVKLDAERAFGYFYRAAQGSSVEAMIEVGKSMLVGYGTVQDVDGGVSWLERAANAGSGGAMYDLFQFYNLDNPADRDTAKALQWLHRATEAGSAEAAFRLALMHRDGDLVEKDPVKSRYWLERAKSAGHAHSAKLLAKLDKQAALKAAKGTP